MNQMRGLKPKRLKNGKIRNEEGDTFHCWPSRGHRGAVAKEYTESLPETHVKAVNTPNCVDTLCEHRLPDLGEGHTAIAGILTDEEITCPECRKHLAAGQVVSRLRTNPALTNIFVKHFKGMFFQKTYRNGQFICDPWWWPRGPGRRKSDWGLPRCDNFVARSLLAENEENLPIKYQYCGFLGSVRALPGCPILVSIRPSRASFQVSFNLDKKTCRLPTVHDERCGDGRRLAPIHFTDIAKFRQRHSQWQDPEEDMDEERWRISVECLADELDYLKAVPQQIIVVKWVNDFLKPRAKLHRMGDLRERWRNDPSNIRLDSALDLIEKAAQLPDHRVSGWKSSAFRSEIDKALAATPPHDPRQYDTDLV